MTRQQMADRAETAELRRYQTRKALAVVVADAERRANAEMRLDLALRYSEGEAN